jgi:CheY-like chemotaxis protein
MKIVRKISGTDGDGGGAKRATPWKVLVVDDEPDIRRLTALNLRGFEFAGRRLDLIEAGSAAEAREQLQQHPDIGLALIDVVMETDDAGLKLVEHIRGELGNIMMRLVIRTGQPGVAPRALRNRPFRHRRLQGQDRTHGAAPLHHGAQRAEELSRPADHRTQPPRTEPHSSPSRRNSTTCIGTTWRNTSRAC